MTYTIDYDYFYENPRDFDGNRTVMVFSNGRYRLPNEIDFDFNAYSSWDEAEKAFLKEVKPEKGTVRYYSRVYMMDHSYLSFSLSPFGGLYGRFDSGCVGFIAITADTIDDNKRRTQEQYAEIAEAELKTYQYYANGEVYCVTILDDDGDIVDSCGGFYGHDSAEESAKEQIAMHKEAGLTKHVVSSDMGKPINER